MRVSSLNYLSFLSARPKKAAGDSSQVKAQQNSKLRLIYELVKREIESRYRGSVLGIVWSMITPLLMLGVYTFVFGTVFGARWTEAGTQTPPAQFAVILFAGLIVYQIFAETIIRAPMLMISHSNYVKKVVFPLEILVPVAIGNALFHAAVSLLILLPFLFLFMGGIPWTIVLLPVVIAPLLLMSAGVGWFLASLGTYTRDIGQFIGTVATAILFLAPIFFPSTALPAWLQPWLALNPVTVPVEQAREVLIFGRLPDFSDLTSYGLVSVVFAGFGFLWFQKTRKGFADVL